MKYAQYIIANDKVEVFNSITGMEEIYINNKKISSKFSVFGTEHFFRLKNNQYLIKSYLDSNLIGMSFEVRKNGVPIDLENRCKIKTIDKIGRFLLAIIFGVGLAFIF
ncbi:hypothetical protein [Aquimarina addita]